MEIKRSFKVNSQLLPKEFPRDFDAHVYFNELTFKKAENLHALMIETFQGQKVFVGQMINQSIGPHPTGMFEANFPVKLFADVVLWLMKEHEELSVLIHPLTGNDYIDHSGQALWLGITLPLDFSKFTL
ncbi:MAG: DOPA 4,5-dioxygenase family protein [Bacteriovorax sp.]|nr:DOPA 4,5-dioxygenase family protein [Bacteriovorax sp.]